MSLPPDTSNSLLVSIELSRRYENRSNIWYQPHKWGDINIVIFYSGPLK
jgi:hypothetical protein